MWFDTKKEVKAHKCCHHNNVAYYSNNVANFVEKKKPFVNMPKIKRMSCYYLNVKSALVILTTIYGLYYKLLKYSIYLGVEPSIGFSMTLRITNAVITVNINHITMKRVHIFLAESKNGIDHIPIKVASCNHKYITADVKLNHLLVIAWFFSFYMKVSNVK